MAAASAVCREASRTAWRALAASTVAWPLAGTGDLAAALLTLAATWATDGKVAYAAQVVADLP